MVSAATTKPGISADASCGDTSSKKPRCCASNSSDLDRFGGQQHAHVCGASSQDFGFDRPPPALGLQLTFTFEREVRRGQKRKQKHYEHAHREGKRRKPGAGRVELQQTRRNHP